MFYVLESPDGDYQRAYKEMFGQTDVPVSTVAAGAVPEPTSFGLGLAALAGLIAARRRVA